MLLFVGQMAIGWMQLKLSRQFATKEELEEVKEDVESHDERIGNVEDEVLVIRTEMKNMPTSKDLCGLRETITEIKGTIEKFDQSNKNFSRAITRIENYLIGKTNS